MNEKELERRAALACLAAIEVNLAELHGCSAWWCGLGLEGRLLFQAFEVEVRSRQHELSNAVFNEGVLGSDVARRGPG